MKRVVSFYLIFFYSILLFSKMDFEKRGKWLNVLPFGVGQYQNYQEQKALLFLISEGVLFSTAIGAAIADSSEDGNKNLQKVELLAFGSFLAIYAWGMIDAFNNYNEAEKKIMEQLKKNITAVINPKQKFWGLAYKLRF